MSPVIRERWIASVIAGFSGNGFTAEVLKAHLTIINGEIDEIPRSELLQAECSKSLLKETGKPVLADINARLPVSRTRTQLVQLLLGYVAAEGCMDDEEAQEVAPIVQEIEDRPLQEGHEDPYGKSYMRRAGEARSVRTGESWWRT